MVSCISLVSAHGFQNCQLILTDPLSCALPELQTPFNRTIGHVLQDLKLLA